METAWSEMWRQISADVEIGRAPPKTARVIDGTEIHPPRTKGMGRWDARFRRSGHRDRLGLSAGCRRPIRFQKVAGPWVTRWSRNGILERWDLVPPRLVVVLVGESGFRCQVVGSCPESLGRRIGINVTLVSARTGTVGVIEFRSGSRFLRQETGVGFSTIAQLFSITRMVPDRHE